MRIESPRRRQLLCSLGALGAGLPWLTGSHRASAAHDPGMPHSRHTGVSAQVRVPYLGAHQAGITTQRPSTGMVASFFVLAENRQDLERLFRLLSARIAFLTQGGPQVNPGPAFPPAGSGILGPVVPPDALTITVSVGASLFDGRFGLTPHKPVRLQQMRRHPNDALNVALCHGDLSIQFCANTPDTNIHALRDIIKHTPDLLILHWKQEGSVAESPKPGSTARNALGFHDGSTNPDTCDTDQMNRIVWVGSDDAEPAWTHGGSYQAIRIVRNFVERWDRTPLQEQEAIFGRMKATGAPLDHGTVEHDIPDYANDPAGARTPLNAHIRLANPRTPMTEANLMLRRSFNYSNGVSQSGQLEMGLLFICYQADLEKGFIAVQSRLDGEPLEEYVRPIGGGFFFSLPGITHEKDWLGRTMIEASA